MAINEERSYTEYNVEVPTTDFPIGFDILDNGIDVVAVTLNDVDPTTLGYTVIQVNSTTYRFAPAVPSGVVRLTRITDIDQMAHVFTEGVIFISENMDGNFKQIRHAQQEVRDAFDFLEYNTLGVVEAARDATDLAKDAAQAAYDAAAQVDALVVTQAELDLAFDPVKRGIANRYDSSLTYNSGDRVVLADGDIVKSTIDGNANDPNTDMTGWVKINDVSQIIDASGKTQQEINNEIVDVERYFKTDLSTTLDLIKSKMTRPYILRFGRGISYTLTSPFILDDLIIGIDLNHCEITYTYEQPMGAGSSSQISAFTQHNRTKPFFSKNGKLKYTGTFNIGTSYAGQISGFDIRTQVGFKGLRYSNIEASGFNRTGIQTAGSGAYIEQYIVEGCYLHHNRVAGEWRGFVDGAYLTKNTCTFNGLDSDIGTGYGLGGIGECYPKNQFVWANDCSNNYRKGIDFHSGANVFVWSNKCHSNKLNGIYVGVDNRLDGVVQPVGTVLIEGNDLLLSDYSGATDNWGLYVGKSFNTETSGVTSIKIKNNTIKRPTANLGNALNLIALDLGGFYRPVVDFIGNTIDVVNCSHAVYVYNSVAASNIKGVLNVKNNNFNISKPNSAFFIFAPNTNVDIFNFCENNVAVENHTFALMTNFSVRKGATPAAWVSGSYINNNMYLPDFNFDDGDLFPNDQRDYILSQGNFLNGKPHRDYKNGIYIATAKTIPTTLYWYRGSIITNSGTSAIAAGSWKCTVAGNAGTWIDANAVASTAGANLVSAANPINTVNKYGGRIVYNTTTGKMYFALSSAPTSAWRAFDGSGDITPT